MQGHVEHLSPESATWRRLHGRPDLLWFLDAWTHTFIKFQSGEKVRLPEPVPHIWRQEHPVQSERKGKLIESLTKSLTGV